MTDVDSLESRFRVSFDLHDPIRYSETMDSLDRYVKEDVTNFGVVGAARRVLAGQAIRRLMEDLNHLDELTLGDSHAGTVLEAESNMGVLLALFIAGREDADGGVLVVAGPQTLGDHLDGISELRVDVGMTQGDFDVEFLLTWNEVNTNPAHYADESQPTGLSHTYRLALVHEEPLGDMDPSDRKTRRLGLESQGLLVETYTADEAGRDPFGVAARAFKRIKRCIDDDYTN